MSQYLYAPKYKSWLKTWPTRCRYESGALLTLPVYPPIDVETLEILLPYHK